MSIENTRVFLAKTGSFYLTGCSEKRGSIEYKELYGPVQKDKEIAMFAAKMFAQDRRIFSEILKIDLSKERIVSVIDLDKICKSKKEGDVPLWAIANLSQGVIEQNPYYTTGCQVYITALARYVAEKHNQWLFLPNRE